MDSAAGKLLVAIPELADPNFFRSVVFVFEHSSEGAMGVVLNRTTAVSIRDLWRRLNSEVNVLRMGNVNVGGPVQGPLIGIHNQFDLNDNEIIEGVYVTMSSDRLNELVTSENGKFRIFNGYSGWGPNQLDKEIAAGGWLIFETTDQEIFGPPNELWKRVCEKIGNQVLFNDENIPNGDPNLN